MRARRIITLCYLCSQGIELFRWRLERVVGDRQLSFVNGVHHFNASDHTARAPKGLEAEHGTCEPFHCSMVLLDDIIEVFTVPHDNGGFVRLVVVRDRGRIRAAFIDRDFLRSPLGANGLAQERLGRVPLARRSQQKIDGVAFFVVA